MLLLAGVRLGSYEIIAPIGSGGMGEIYRARDARLNRTVAIKVLRPHFAADPEFRDRFDREARVVAALNHPHICTLCDIGAQDGTAFLVMEHLEGDTLADRLAKGALPLDQALTFAIEIAGALDKAHRAGGVPPLISSVRSQGKKGSGFSRSDATESVNTERSPESATLRAVDRVARRCLAKAPEDRWQFGVD